MGAKSIPCSIYRGGTSRGVYFLENDLPYPESVRTQILLNIFGSPGPSQIDGVGGGTPNTNKTMIVGPSEEAGSGVRMLFGQISVNIPMVDWSGTCGNLTTAVGPFAIDQGLVAALEPITEVMILNINTQRRVIARVPVRSGKAVSEGDYSMPGVSGTGARIDLEFIEPTGTLNGRLLPTGKPCERIELEDGRRFTVSIVDAGNVVVFCHAPELGLLGTELPSEMEGRREVMATLEEIRSIAAERLGIVKDRKEASSKSPGTPKIGFVSRPVPYSTIAQGRINREEIDIVGRLLSMQTAHGAYMGAGAICTGAAAMTKGTIVHELCNAESWGKRVLRIGHPQGVMDVSIKVADVNGETRIQSATIARTARRIMEGYAYVPEGLFLRD